MSGITSSNVNFTHPMGREVFITKCFNCASVRWNVRYMVLCILDLSFLELRIYFFKDKSLHLLIDCIKKMGLIR